MELARFSADKFGSLPDDVERSERAWKEWFDNDTPESISYPGKYEERLGEFDKLCLLRYDVWLFVNVSLELLHHRALFQMLPC